MKIPLSGLVLMLTAVLGVAQIPTTGLVARYRFDGNANDSGPNALHATNHGATLTTDRYGRANSAYAFNGTSHYLEIADDSRLSLPTTGELSISVWMRPDVLIFPVDQSTGYVNWLGKGTGVNASGQQEYTFRMYSVDNTEGRENRTSFYLFNLAGDQGAGSNVQEPVTIGTWIHYVATASVSADRIKLYKNGVFKDQDTFLGSPYFVVPQDGTAPLRIGTRDFASYFQGAIDDVMIYDRALTAAEVEQFYAGPGHLDLTFNSGTGKVTTPVGSGDDRPQSVAVQSDGRIVVVGYASNGTNDDFALVRFLPDGSLDSDFGTGGKVTTAIGTGSDAALAAIVLPDGRIVAAGYALSGSYISIAVARYLPSGALDTTFSGDGKVITVGASESQASAVALDSSGRILVGGYLKVGAQTLFCIVRYQPDGSLDPTFDGDGIVTTAFTGVSDQIQGLVVQPDGRIVAAGFSNSGGNNDIALARYEVNGSLDPSFGTGGKVVTAIGSSHDFAETVLLQPDEKIVVAGSSFNGSNDDFAVVRYEANGSLDPSFGTGGKVTTAIGGGDESARGLALQANGKILATGPSHNGSNDDFALVRYLPDGTLDATFRGTGKVITAIGSGRDVAEAVAIQGDGQIVVAGWSATATVYDFAVARYLGDPHPPIVQTLAATDLEAYTATLHGTVNPNGVATTAWFEYGLSPSYGTSTGVQSLGSGVSPVAVTANLSGLSPATTYHARLVAQNEDGVTYGDDIPFTTGPLAPEIRVFAGADDTAPELTDGQATAVDFGSTVLGTPVTSSFTVKNVGAIDLHLTSLSLPAGYEHVGGAFAPVTLAPIATHTFQVRFLAHTVHGTFAGPMSLANDDGNEAPFDVPLTAVSTGLLVGGGSLDTSFNGTGKVTTPIGNGHDEGRCVAVQSDGKIVVAGYSSNGSNQDFALVRYTSTGALDASFGSGGKVTTPIGSSDDMGWSVAVESDGKIVVGGRSINGSNFDFALVRYTETGVLDASFGSGGRLTTPIGSSDDQGISVAVQSDGKIVVAGCSWNSSNYDFALVRYTETGALDASFGSGGKVTTSIGSNDDLGFSVAVQSDGKIVVAGFSSNGSNPDFALVRYTETGALDASFGSGGKVTTPIGSNDDYGYSVVVQSDGKIVVAGSSSTGSNWDFALVRYTETGALDASFGSGGKVTTPIGSSHDYCYSVALQSDGKIVVAGHSSNGSWDFALVRYTETGALDASFGSGGKVTTPFGSNDDFGLSVVVQSDGGIVVAGSSSNGSNSDFALVRYNGGTLTYPSPAATTQVATSVTKTAAMLNGTVNPNGIVTAAWFEYGTSTGYGQTTASQPLGYGTSATAISAHLAGLTPGTTYHYRLVAQNGETTAHGADMTFTTLALAPPTVTLAAATSITATTASLSGTVNPNGLTATAQFEYGTTTGYGTNAPVSFSPNDGTTAQAVGVNLTGLIPGTLYHYRLAATNSDGLAVTSDGTFFTTGPGSLATGFGVEGKVTTSFGSGNSLGYGVAAQSDGKVVVAGAAIVAGNYDFAVARYNADGTLDPTFNGTGQVTTAIGLGSDQGRAVAVQSDGRIVVAGVAYNGSTDAMALVRYHSDGTLDTTFNGTGKVTTVIGGTSDTARSVVLQPDGRIIAAGFSVVGGQFDFAMVRYNSDGTLDSSFNGTGKVTTPIGTNSDLAQSVALQSDGKILVAGTAGRDTPGAFVALARYHSNGSLDTSFNTTGKVTTAIGGSSDGGTGVGAQSDGKIVVGGYTWNGSNYDFAVVRYTASGSLDPSFGTGGKVTTPIGNSDESGYSMALQADGKIVIAGPSVGSTEDFALVRYTANGALDTSFNGTGKVTTPIGSGRDVAEAIAIQSDGQIVAAGWSIAGSTADFAVARYVGDPHPPIVQTLASTNVLPYTATLNGSVNPNGLATTAWFEYGLSPSYGTSTATQNFSNGTSAVAVTASLSGLTPGTLYHARLVAENADGVTYGDDTTFTTVPLAPEIRVFAGPDDAAPELTDGQATAVDFGSTVLGTPVTRSFTVKNVGNIDLHLTSLSLPAGYERVGGAFAPVTLASDATHTFQVRFLAYTVHGTFAGLVSLGNDDGNEAPFDVPLTAVATGMIVGGSLDTSFNGTGKVITQIGSDDGAYSMALQSDGKIVVAGYSRNGGNNDFALVRYTATGALDASFGSGGKVTTPIGSSQEEAKSVAVQSDGKIVVAGRSANGSNSDFAVVRFTDTGALDAGFGAGGKVTTPIGNSEDWGWSVAVQSDGKIVVAGDSDNGSNHDFALVRYTDTGALDAAFGSSGKVTTPIGSSYDHGYSMALQTDGKIVVVGRSRSNSDDIALVRYTDTGALDASFGSGGKVTTPISSSNEWGYSVALQSDGKIVVAGSLGNGSNYDFALFRYADTGALDTTFGSGGTVSTPIGGSYDYGYSVAVQSDGKIVVAGYSDNGSNYDFALVRYTDTGALDASFGSGGKVTTQIGGSHDFGESVAVQSDGKIVVAGSSYNGSNYDFALVRYNGGILAYPSPAATTQAATSVTKTAATLNGTVNPNGIVTAAWFEYGTTTGYGQTTASQALGYGTSATALSSNLTGLTPGTPYHYRLVAQNGETTTYGADMTFTTLTEHEAWRQTYFGNPANSGPGADEADPDDDDSSNLLEFAFGTDPTSAASGSGSLAYAAGAITQRGQPTVSITTTPTGVDFRAVFGRRKDWVTTGLIYTVQFSADMSTGSWEDSPAIPAIVASDAEMDAVSVPYPFFLSTGHKAQFFRVTVTSP